VLLASLLRAGDLTDYDGWKRQGAPAGGPTDFIQLDDDRLSLRVSLANGCFTVAEPDGVGLLYGWERTPWSGGVRLQVDGICYSTATIVCRALEMLGQPHSHAGGIRTIWRASSVRLQQDLTVVTLMGGRQVLRIDFTSRNLGDFPREVELSLLLDPQQGDNDCAMIGTTGGLLPLQQCCDQPAAMPAVWEVRSCAPAPAATPAACGILSGSGVTPPARFLIGEWAPLYRNDPEPLRENATYYDAAVVINWEEGVLPPGADCGWSTLYGSPRTCAVDSLPTVTVTSAAEYGCVEGELMPETIALRLSAWNRGEVVSQPLFVQAVLPPGLLWDGCDQLQPLQPPRLVPGERGSALFALRATGAPCDNWLEPHFTLYAGGQPIASVGHPVWVPCCGETTEFRQPAALRLEPNYPNPFNPRTTFRFELSAPGYTELRLFNLRGEPVALPVAGHLAAGNHRIDFDGSELASGVYFYRLRSGGAEATRKMTLIR